MGKHIDNFLSRFRRKVAPTDTAGTPGTAIFGGFVIDEEKDPNLSSREERYKTYSEILANTSIVAAGTRYFLNLIAKAEWTFVPAEGHLEGEKFAELAKEMLTEDPRTSWHRVVRRAAMYRFYGFSIQEWTAKRRDDGLITFEDIAPRAQLTIERWDVDETGMVLGMLQRSPQTQEELYIPRTKTLYMVDDTLSDSPEGLGLFRHLVSSASRLARYEQLEGFGFETDLRGVPVGRGPFTELASMVEAGTISQAQRTQIEAPLRKFIGNHVKTAKLGILLDSITYESKDEAGRASSAKQWDVELLKSSGTSFAENAAAIERLNRELARVLGVEQLLLGAGAQGSFALSRDKTAAFFLLVDAALNEVKETVEDDLLVRLWELNGFPVDAMPKISTEAIRFTDVEQVAAVLRDVATAGAPIDINDPIINEVRRLMGMPPAPDRSLEDDEDSALTGAGSETDDNIEDILPEDDDG